MQNTPSLPPLRDPRVVTLSIIKHIASVKQKLDMDDILGLVCAADMVFVGMVIIMVIIPLKIKSWDFKLGTNLCYCRNSQR